MNTFLATVSFAAHILLASAAGGTPAPDAVTVESDQQQVLALYASSPDAQVSTVGDRQLRKLLTERTSRGVDYYSEFIDQRRYKDGDYRAAFAQFLALKYKGHRFALVLAMDHVALEFLEGVRSQLFPDAPAVFFSARAVKTRLPNSTGMNAPVDFRGTLELLAALQPEVRQIVVVNGMDQSYEDIAREQFKPFASRFTFTWLTRLATEDLEARLSTLPHGSAVFYAHVAQDGVGRNLNTLDYLERVTSIATAPTYSWATSAMGRGVVGGRLRSLEVQVAAIGDLAIRVLRGEAADSIPILRKDLNVTQVDWRQLQRWNISEARVPPGAIILFRDPTVWTRYRLYISGAIVLFLAQSLLIAGLLVERLRRRRAEKEASDNRTRLQMSFDRIRDLGQRLLTAQESERARIARELHDDIGQQVTLLAIDLDVLGGAPPAAAPGMVREVAGRAQTIARSVHDLSHRLHPARLRLIGLVAALEGLQREMAQGDIAIVFTHDRVPATLAPDVTLCLFRIAQEALQNAVRYSGARAIHMDVTGRVDALVLSIADDGVGFEVDAAIGKGLGLISIAERAESVGGAATIHSTPGAGARLEVTVPIRMTPIGMPIPHSRQVGLPLA